MPEHAADILAYAARHDYPDILDIATLLVVKEETLSETLPKLPLNTMLRWVREKYYYYYPFADPSVGAHSLFLIDYSWLVLRRRRKRMTYSSNQALIP